jgi:Family of unknown function (DUF6338)
MPTSFTGLLLFVVLLLPGFAYQVGKDRSGAERRPPAFRETVSIVAASVISELLVLIVTWPLWAWALNVHHLVRAPGKYWQDRPGVLVGWGLGLLFIACGIAYVATLRGVRRWALTRRILGDYPHESTMSAWWRLFEELRPDLPLQRRYVSCVLEDGTFVAGRLLSFNRAADDLGDRDLILGEPLQYRAKGDDVAVAYPADTACVSARRIKVMFVTYLNR